MNYSADALQLSTNLVILYRLQYSSHYLRLRGFIFASLVCLLATHHRYANCAFRTGCVITDCRWPRVGPQKIHWRLQLKRIYSDLFTAICINDLLFSGLTLLSQQKVRVRRLFRRNVFHSLVALPVLSKSISDRRMRIQGAEASQTLADFARRTAHPPLHGSNSIAVT